MSKRIFLTGSHGFVGSHLLSKLIEQGYEVETDMRYLHTRKYECLIHLAAKNNIKNEFDADLIESNIILTREIFKVNCRIIYGSSCVAAYPLNPYAYSKLYAEHLGAIHGNALGLRFHNIYGPNNRKGIVWFLMQQKDMSRITIRGAELVRDYIHVSNVVDYIIRVLDFSLPYLKAENVQQNLIQNLYRGVIDVGTGVGTKTIDLLTLFSKLSGKRFGVEVIPPDASEPLSMISNNVVPHISLEEGLNGMLKKDLGQPVLSDIYKHIKNNK